MIKEFNFYYVLIDISSKYVWDLPLKGKKGIAITNAFQKIFRRIQSQTKRNMGSSRQ